jgi:hypothetical protein
MLTQHEVISYLLEHRLIQAASIVAGDLIVEDVSRRNRNFKIISQHGPCYLIKQGVGPEGTATVAREGAMYQLLCAAGSKHQFDRYLPLCYGYDEQAQILILELLHDAQDLRAYYSRRTRFSTTLAAALGDALGVLHQLAWADVEQGLAGQMFIQQPPWVLALGCPDGGILRDVSGANLQLLRLIQQSTALCQLLGDLHHGWEPTTLIHRDIKWDNCLALAQQSAGRRLQLKIADWELADLGDPCWDIGSVFSNYLSHWLLSIPITGEDPPEHFMQLARYPLEHMQPALRTCWQAYVRRTRLNPADADRWLVRATMYAAARLIQTAFEHLQMAAYLTGNIVCLVQLSMNILLQPQAAAEQLLGISPRT